ncbi:MAG TPA: VRR-NUC domain-containing protein [Methylomirabilota bacterium]|nr:VRR-NUC domain-containing protein [Methylomirabilota bacterium]
MKERSIEQAAVRKMREAGVDPLKVGDQGWPDRLVLLGGGRHFWIEFKAPGGKLRPAQVRRIRSLLARRESVLTVDSAEGALEAVKLLRRMT